MASRPSRRGVDRNMRCLICSAIMPSRPSRRGVDRNKILVVTHVRELGRPSRRGVDRNTDGMDDKQVAERSPLAQGRGSKRHPGGDDPRVPRRPSRRGVDRNAVSLLKIFSPGMSPLAQGRGSKLLLQTREFSGANRRPSRRGVDRNPNTAAPLLLPARRPSRRGVDRNSRSSPRTTHLLVAPRAGAWIETAWPAWRQQ